MSLDLKEFFQAVFRFPRVSGDEPVIEEGDFLVFMFSPRERG